MRVESVSEFLIDATNVYRTREYIVRQQIMLHDGPFGSYLMSRDTYYRCNAQRDREFEKAFSDRINVSGKRIPTAMHMREYID